MTISVNVPLLQDPLEGFQVFAKNPLSLNFPFEDGRDIVIMGPIDRYVKDRLSLLLRP
jgi:hypothetical protein